jgi:hypothetical protein
MEIINLKVLTTSTKLEVLHSVNPRELLRMIPQIHLRKEQEHLNYPKVI